ncbi:MAG: hypothetical protein AB7I30_20165, partial [Isosphaeraceae bacterium]
YHTLEGLLMLGFGLSLLRGECWILDQIVDLTHLAEPPQVPNDDAWPDSPEPTAVGTGVPTRTDHRSVLRLPPASAGG